MKVCLIIQSMSSRNERSKLAYELRQAASVAGTHPISEVGEVRFELVKTTTSYRETGLLYAVTSDGRRLPILSTSAPGEKDNAGDYIKQRDIGIRLARQKGLPFTELDMDFALEVLEARRALDSKE